MSKKSVLSGIQPTGGLHLGNYLGAIKHWVDGQRTPGPRLGGTAPPDLMVMKQVSVWVFITLGL